MKRFITIKSNGEVDGVMNVVENNCPEVGFNADNSLYVVDITDTDKQDLWYISGDLVYNFNTHSFENRPMKPNNFSKWEDGSWIFQYEDFIVNLKRLRNRLLFSSDWTQVNDAPLTPEKKQEWATYRQQLRDLPSSYENLTEYVEPVFPEPPKG